MYSVNRVATAVTRLLKPVETLWRWLQPRSSCRIRGYGPVLVRVPGDFRGQIKDLVKIAEGAGSSW